MIFALKTADNTTGLWLYSPDGAVTAEQSWDSGRALADELLGQLTEFLQRHGASLGDLTGIIVFSGPGSFTSLRIGHTVANALADSLQIPVVGAMGDGWAAAAIAALSSTPVGQSALPHYGAEANITKPKT
jgi:tRNA threonylcarbamoyladenosine biosynthesis protein TsaB